MLTHEPQSRIDRPVPKPWEPPACDLADGAYLARFARTREEIDACLELRFAVFNLELGEGLESSFLTGRDEDEYDRACHHLMVIERATDRVVGTYRLMTAETALAWRGFYSTGEFDLGMLPAEVLLNSVELGRACIARDHRNTRVLFLLWKGIASYIRHSGKRYLFGCCSLTSQEPAEGLRLGRQLEAEGFAHETLYATPRAGFECVAPSNVTFPAVPVRPPQLFGIYLRFGAKICSPPAIDRAFGTIDFLVVFDVAQLDDRSKRMFFGA